ncbi:MAG: ComEA family DNA-binding protein [Steroidobacteraceae bacterium]
MGLLDRDYMRRARKIGTVASGGGGGMQKLLMIAVIAIPLAIGAWQLYKKFDRESAPGEGGLVVNINLATQQELETIPGVGPVLAREIIRERPYEKVEDLNRVKGIGSYTINSIRPYVKVEGETGRRE